MNTDCQKLKENLVKAAEGKEASGDKKDTHETETAEESSAINNSESSKSNLNVRFILKLVLLWWITNAIPQFEKYAHECKPISSWNLHLG